MNDENRGEPRSGRGRRARVRLRGGVRGRTRRSGKKRVRRGRAAAYGKNSDGGSATDDETMAETEKEEKEDASSSEEGVDELDPPRRGSERGTSVSWRILWEAPFLDAARSPALSRAFFVPGWSSKRNVYGTYRVYGKETR